MQEIGCPATLAVGRLESFYTWNWAAAVVGWDGPERPIMNWITLRRWKRLPTSKRLTAAQRKALGTSRFFRTYQLCGERNNSGHMHDRSVCQSCAEEYLGVVY